VTKTIFMSNEVQKKIRKAYRARQKTIGIGAHTYTIKLLVRKVSYESGGETHQATEKWLVLNRADGSHLPSGQIELTDGCNLRTQMA
jgi:hypothetical protein